jgi:ribokinase
VAAGGPGTASGVDVMVAGQLARDLVLRVDELPPPGASAQVRERLEMLGGKGANCAVAVAQLGTPVGLLAVAGDDDVGDRLLAQAGRDGIDTRHVVRRAGTATGLVVNVLEPDASWRYLEDLPARTLLDPDDVEPAAAALHAARAVVLQAQQPGPALLACLRHARGLVVLDGAPEPEARTELLRGADVVRADPAEAALLVDRQVATDDVDRMIGVGRGLLDAGPDLVVLGVEGAGNVAVWEGGQVFVPFGDAEVVDTTGGGDSLTAALTVALLGGRGPEDAVRRAVAAAADTVSRAGGRPDLADRSPVP